MVVASVALFVALSGGAYATTQALIGSAQIKNGSIELADISAKAKKALKGQRGPRGFSGANGANGANGLPGPQGPQGPAGPQGAPGANGANGANGGFDPSKVSYVTGPATTIPANDIGTATATCPPNTVVIGGGFFTSIGIPADSQTFSGNSWTVIVNNFDNSIALTGVYAFAVCAAR
jgi:hypothetical protein